MNLFVSELDFQTRRIDLRSHFEQKGKVGSESMTIRKGAAHGVGKSFVECSNKNEGMKSNERVGLAIIAACLRVASNASTGFIADGQWRLGFVLGALA